jgi:signal transduction histidine kinase
VRTARRRRGTDVALTAGLLCFVWLGISVAQGPPNLGAAILAVLIVAPLLVRRQWPLAALTVCLAASAWYHLLEYPHEAVIPPLVVALYTVAATGGRRRSLLIAAGIGALVVVVMAVGDVGGPSEAFGVIGWIGLAIVLGEVARSRTAMLSTAEDRTARAERERAAESALRRAEAAQREAETRRRVAEERLRIARDLHDVLAHSIAVINAQASVATHLAQAGQSAQRQPAGEQPGGLVVAMATIAQTSRTAMGELRATLDVLRGHDSSMTSTDERAPAPGVARLGGLIESARSAGVAVTVDTIGVQRRMTPVVDVTAYRIVQEALTNVARHARGSTARVAIEYRPASVRLTVTDDGGAATETGTGGGYGIVGMTERAHAVGGWLTARPRDGGGYQVIADLPAQEGDTP